MMTASILSNMLSHWALYPELKSTRDSEFSMPKVKIGPKDSIHSPPWPRSSTTWAADSQNGEPSFKSVKDSLQNKPSKKTLGVLQDMPPFAKRTVLCRSLNQKSCLTVHTQLSIVKRLPKRFWLQCLQLCKKTTSFWKDACWNQTWLLTDQLIQKRLRTTWRRRQSEQFVHFQDQFHQRWWEWHFCQEDRQKKRRHCTWITWTR